MALTCPGCGASAPDGQDRCSRCGAPLADPLIGTVVGERYRILGRIGAGGMGVVYRAEHTMMKKDLAVKVLLPELGGREEYARRFEREAESASRLDHPNIITVTDFGSTPQGALFLVMEFLPGRTLTTEIRRGPLPVPRALTIIRQVLHALEHAHAAGVVHRDLKPDNIMLLERGTETDVVKILDFGIAKLSEPASGGGETLTQAGLIFGTPEYLSPEQALGEAVDQRADLYAAGVILYELLAGRRPFESQDKVRLISMHLAHPAPRIAEVNPSVMVPAAIEEATLQALEKQRANRFASAGAFLQALSEAEGEGALTAGVVPVAAHTGAVRRATPSIAATATIRRATPSSAAGGELQHAPARAVRWRRWAVVAGIAAVTASAGLALLPSRASDPSAPAPRPAPALPATAAAVKSAEELLTAGNIIGARTAVEDELKAHPQDARLRHMLGRVAFAEDRHGEALSAYREAIRLDPGFRGDAMVLEHVRTALSEPHHAEAALDLIIDSIGKPAAALLEDVANQGSDVQRRVRAAHALDDLGEGQRVAWLPLHLAELKRATSCDERRQVVVTLRKLGDPKALPALRALRTPKRGLRRLLSRIENSNNECMREELADTIAELEKKPGAEDVEDRRFGSR